MKVAIPLISMLALATFPVATHAQAGSTPDEKAAAFAKVDTNGDGAISLSEWTAAGRRERGFKMVDTNGDGKVTPAELQAAMAKYKGGK